jgi:transposase
MQNMYYVGLDVHKRIISYCVKDGSGQVYSEGVIPATRWDLDRWMKTLPQPWTAAMEATIFTGWIYNHLKPHAAALKVAHPLMLRAIAAAKKRNDRIDATKICDCRSATWPRPPFANVGAPCDIATCWSARWCR